MEKLNLKLLGEFGLQSQRGQSIRISSKKARTLVAYLASRPGHPVSRVELARMLWEKHDEPQALTNLRQNLSVINNQLCGICPNWLIKDSGFISLNSTLFTSDIGLIHELAGTTDRAKLERVTELFSGSFLEGLAFNEESVTRWLEQARQKYELQQIELRKTTARKAK